MAPQTQAQMDRVPPDGGLVAAAFEGDEIEEIAERLVALTTTQAGDLHHYLADHLGPDPPTPPTQPRDNRPPC